MLTKRYLTSIKNLPAIMEKIKDGTAPNKFTSAHLKGIGFKSSSDQPILPLLKELGFLSDDGTPTQRYHDYRDKSRSKAVMASALRESYEEIFHINERPTESDRPSIAGKFKSEHNVTDAVAKKQVTTFFALLQLADLNADDPRSSVANKTPRPHEDTGEHHDEQEREKKGNGRPREFSLRYNVEVHLPATKDIEVYNAIFKSLREHIIDD